MQVDPDRYKTSAKRLGIYFGLLALYLVTGFLILVLIVKINPRILPVSSIAWLIGYIIYGWWVKENYNPFGPEDGEE